MEVTEEDDDPDLMEVTEEDDDPEATADAS